MRVINTSSFVLTWATAPSVFVSIVAFLLGSSTIGWWFAACAAGSALIAWWLRG